MLSALIDLAKGRRICYPEKASALDLAYPAYRTVCLRLGCVLLRTYLRTVSWNTSTIATSYLVSPKHRRQEFNYYLPSAPWTTGFDALQLFRVQRGKIFFTVYIRCYVHSSWSASTGSSYGLTVSYVGWLITTSRSSRWRRRRWFYYFGLRRRWGKFSLLPWPRMFGTTFPKLPIGTIIFRSLFIVQLCIESFINS